MDLKRLKRKTLGAFLAAALLLQMFPTFIIAKADGTDFTGYTAISDKAGLDSVRNNLSGKYYLTADITFTAADFASGGDFCNFGAGWKPIGTDSTSSFNGIFDGNGHCIKGLFCNSNTVAGLFDYNQGTIINLGMVKFNISVGSTTLSTCAGGIAGLNYGNIINCYSAGIVSTLTSVFTACTGGIAGVNGGYISKCYNTGVVRTITSGDYNTYTGGIAGENHNAIINNCFNTGAIKVDSSSYFFVYIGGIFGYNYSTTMSTIINCYNAGSISPLGGQYGGIAGDSTSAIRNCYYLNITNIGSGGYSTDTTTKLTLEQMEDKSSFAGFDFTNVWTIDNTSSYKFPTLIGMPYVETYHFSNSQITGMEPVTTVNELIDYFIKYFDGSIQVLDQNSNNLTGSTLISTGMTIKIITGDNVSTSYTAVIYGDIDGDGTINSLDLLLLKKHLLNSQLLSGIYLEASNTDRDTANDVNSLDLLKLKKHILQSVMISQN